jgi:hypothetical protein
VVAKVDESEPTTTVLFGPAATLNCPIGEVKVLLDVVQLTPSVDTRIAGMDPVPTATHPMALLQLTPQRLAAPVELKLTVFQVVGVETSAYLNSPLLRLLA